MALVCKVDSYDISSYVQAASDAFDPAHAFAEPQFAGNALSDGDLFIQMTKRNKEWTIPLIVQSASNDALASTVRTITSHLKQGVTLEYREDGATASTYFDVETARLDVEYRYQRNRQGVGKFVLKVWTRPLGHSGTTRLVASTLATQGYSQFPVASMAVVGDSAALGVLSGAMPTTANAQMTSLVWGYSGRSEFNGLFTAGSALVGLNASHLAATHGLVPTAIAMASYSGGNAIDCILTFPGAASPWVTPTAMRGERVRVFADIWPRAQATPNGSAIAFAYTVAEKITASAGGNITVATGPRVDIADSWSTTASNPKFGLYDLGEVSVPSDPYGRVRIRFVTDTVTPSHVLATVAGGVYLAIDAAIAIPNARGALAASHGAVTAQFGAATVSGVSGVYGANASNSGLANDHTNLVSLRGGAPDVPVAATGVLCALSGGPRNFGVASSSDRYRTFGVAAREQFTYLR